MERGPIKITLWSGTLGLNISYSSLFFLGFLITQNLQRPLYALVSCHSDLDTHRKCWNIKFIDIWFISKHCLVDFTFEFGYLWSLKKGENSLLRNSFVHVIFVPFSVLVFATFRWLFVLTERFKEELLSSGQSNSLIELETFHAILFACKFFSFRI